MRGGGGLRDLSQWEYSCAHGAQMNFGEIKLRINLMIFPTAKAIPPPSFWAMRNPRNLRTNPNTNIPTVSSSTGRVSASLWRTTFGNFSYKLCLSPTAGIGQSFCHIFLTFLDPYVFGPPGSTSGSISQRYGSWSFYHQAKIVRKKNIDWFDSYCFVTSLWLFILKNVPSKSNK